MPWIGTAVALAAVGAAVRRKGMFGGVVDTALDATPGVGAVKNLFEAIRGRDFIKDKRAQAAVPRDSTEAFPPVGKYRS
jgi:hypothetical protein